MTDVTTSLSDYFNGAASYDLAPNKFLYISSALPFRQIYFALGTEVATNETLQIEYYAGTTHQWVQTTYTRDETNGLSNSGYITLQPDRNKPWAIINNTASVAELSDYTFYENYWIRISLSAETSVSLQWIGSKFCSTTQLYRQYPAVNNPRILEAFGAGKTDWEDQTVIASEIIIEDLRKDFAFDAAAQIADRTNLQNACIYRTVALIYTGLGDVGVDNVERAMEQYRLALKAGALIVDEDQNGLISPSEKKPRQSILVR